ncbi:MAG: diguanylate cyclase [Candidatus Saccharicenans sp.]
MNQINILVYVKNIDQALRVIRVSERECQPLVIHSKEEIPSILENRDIWALIVEAEFGSYEHWKDYLKPECSIIILSQSEAETFQAYLTWPVEFHLDFIIEKDGHSVEPILSQALKRSIYLSRIRREWNQLKQSVSLNTINTRHLFNEIVEIKHLINENYIRELEKRISIETRYVWFQKEREKIENIIRKIYSANDVSSLLSIVPDIKELLQAQGLTIYIIEENEALGKFLKPIIWDDSFINHPETFKYVARLDAPDFAAAVARFGQEVNISDLTYDKRYSPRYQNNLKTPLKSIMAVPILYAGETIGVVELYNKLVMGHLSSEGFSKDDQHLLRNISEHLGIAMTKLNLIQYDALTGLLRGEAFFEKVLQKVNSLSKRKREEGSFALVMGDVDWFKNYNDRNGHEAGNRLLQELSTILKQSVREDDLICRYGGEEFLFFLSGVSNLEEACQLTERIRKNVEEHYFPFEEFQPGNNLTMSFGVTIFPRKRMAANEPLTIEDLKHLVHESDLALAEAKGKQTWRLPPSDIQHRQLTKNTVVAYSRDWEKFNHAKPTISFQEKLYREKRHFQRYYTSTVLLYRENGELKVSKTINISLGGVKFISEKPYPSNLPLEVVLILGKKAHPLKSEVVYSERAGNDSPHFYTGLKFTSLSSEDFQVLENYFEQIQKQAQN